MSKTKFVATSHKRPHRNKSIEQLADKILELEARWGKEIADIHEVLTWLGAENQTRANDIAQFTQEANPGKIEGKLDSSGKIDRYLRPLPHVKNRHTRQQTCPLAGRIHPGRTGQNRGGK